MASVKKEPREMATRSAAVCEEVKGSHDFVIKGFSSTKGFGPSNFIRSDVFDIGGHRWQIVVFPDVKDFVAVFVMLLSEGTDVRARFRLTVVDLSRKGEHKVFEGAHALKGKGSVWGYKRLYQRASLETSNFLKDDTLVMHCDVGVIRTRLESLSMPPKFPDMSKIMKEMLESGLGSDVIFEVKDETFKAHKSILAACSPIFKAQFYSNDGYANTDKVAVEDMEPPVFKSMLIFIYSGVLPESSCTSTITMQHLLAAASRYKLDFLKLQCAAKLSKQLALDTLATTLALAYQHNCSTLRFYCLKFIAESRNLGAFMKTKGYEDLKVTWPSLASDLLEAVARHDKYYSLSRQKRDISSVTGSNQMDGADPDGKASADAT